ACGICARLVRWVLRHDRRGVFRFAGSSTDAARRMLERHGMTPGEMRSAVYVRGGECLSASDAAIAIARELGGIWRLAVVLRVVPRALRDAVYLFFARHRYRLNGEGSSCARPDDATRDRFLS